MAVGFAITNFVTSVFSGSRFLLLMKSLLPPSLGALLPWHRLEIPPELQPRRALPLSKLQDGKLLSCSELPFVAPRRRWAPTDPCRGHDHRAGLGFVEGFGEPCSQ